MFIRSLSDELSWLYMFHLTQRQTTQK